MFDYLVKFSFTILYYIHMAYEAIMKNSPLLFTRTRASVLLNVATVKVTEL